MYCDFFGLKEKPFNITPNPKFIFLSKNHKEVFAHLLYGIRNHSGFIEITGEVGTGKTTTLRTLLSQLDGDAYRLAFIFNPSLSALELLRSINREYGIDDTANSAAELLSGLNAFLLQENAAGRTVVLVIDEAQNLEPAVLEQIRLLSNLETETDKLIQIILVGQPELGAMLSRPELRQLSQRITVRYHLRPMDFDDARAYVEHRLQVAGLRNAKLFSPGALRRIHRFAKGFPRLINILCDRTLLVAFTESSKTITRAMVETATSELQRQSRAARPQRRRWPALAALALVMAGLGGGLAWRLSPEPESPMATKAAAAVKPESRHSVAAVPPAPSVVDLSLLRRQMAAFDQATSATEAFNELARLWGAPPLPSGRQVTDATAAAEAFRSRGLVLTPVRGSLNLLLGLDSPALVELTLPGTVGRRYLAITSLNAERVAVTPAVDGRSELQLAELQGLWSGLAYLPWRNHLHLPYLGRPGETGEVVLRLQGLLKESGSYSGRPTGRYDGETIAAVTRFQALRRIAQDGRVGPQTLMLLYQTAGRFDRPVLQPAKAGEGS